jgi:hypothetical protein
VDTSSQKRDFMFGKCNGFASKARVFACTYFLVYTNAGGLKRFSIEFPKLFISINMIIKLNAGFC